MGQRTYPKHEVTRDVWDLACERMAKTYKRFDTVVVYFSGGKDSTVILHVALEAARALNKGPVEVAFFDEEAIPFDTVDYCERVRNDHPLHFRWLCLPIKHRNACSSRSPWWYPWDPDCPELWTRALPDDVEQVVDGTHHLPIPLCAGWLYPPTFGQVASVMGIRTQESLNRYNAIAGNKTGHDAFFAGDHWRHVTRSYPIYDWTHEDVWLASKQFGWDYNRAYDLMAAAGVPVHNQRCAPPFGEQPLERLWTYHLCWPLLWDKMCRRVPGAATAGRYARTELYGYGKSMTGSKPANVTWSAFVKGKLAQFPPEDRGTCALGLTKLLDWHRNRTRDPIPDDIPHPDSGLSWKEIAQVVIRGDLKGRKVMSLKAKAAKSARTSAEKRKKVSHV